MSTMIADMWLCICCTMIHANGECGDHEHEYEPLSRIPDGCMVTLGLLAEEHEEWCDVYKEGGWPVNYECDCERRDFSKSTCDGCGDWHHGGRHAAALWSD